MYQGVKIVAMVTVFICLLLGVAQAVQVTVVDPNGGEVLISGEIYEIVIDVDNPLFKPAKYELYYSCAGLDFMDEGDKIWKMIAMRNCSTVTGCYPTYLWEVPSVQTEVKAKRRCKVMVKLFDANGNAFATDKSDEAFKILPYVGQPLY